MKTTPREVGGERVALVDAAVQELQVVGELVVELEHDGRDEQPEEPEVDERVHEAGGGVAQQRLHPDAGAEVAPAAGGGCAWWCGGRRACRARSCCTRRLTSHAQTNSMIAAVV